MSCSKQYLLDKLPSTSKTDNSIGQADYDIIAAHHKFLWDSVNPSNWKEQLAKKYSDKLFKEYCISDLSNYKKNAIALRWRTQKELICGKGETECGNKHCSSKESLKTWEVNFAYIEQGQNKNALVKLKLCKDCSPKLHYYYEAKKKHNKKKDLEKESPNCIKQEPTEIVPKEEKRDVSKDNTVEEEIEKETSWGSDLPSTEKSIEQRIEGYLEDLFV